MACDPQEPLPAVAVDVVDVMLEQRRRSLLVDNPRRRLHAASPGPGGGAVVLEAAACHAPAQLAVLPRRVPTGEEEEEQALARTTEGSSGETSGFLTALLLNSHKNGGGGTLHCPCSFSKQALCICTPAAAASTPTLLLHLRAASPSPGTADRHAPAQLAAVAMLLLPRRAPPTGEEEELGDAAVDHSVSGKHALETTAEDTSGETSGPVTAPALLLNKIGNRNRGGSFSKEALLGRLCICNTPAASYNDRLFIPIFVRDFSKELSFRVSLEQSSEHLMNLYTEKTKIKFEGLYFVYGRKRLEPGHTLLYYGVEPNTRVHVCGRLLGGVVTIQEYLINKEEFSREVTLPDGRVSLEMTKEGCLFLSTWLKCFTAAFANSKSWGGNFTLNDFKVVNGHVRVITIANGTLTSSSMHADFVKLVGHIRTIFYSNKPNLISNFPPYLENLTTFLVSRKSPALFDEDRLFIETHMCCVESAARGLLLVWLRRKYKSMPVDQQRIWDKRMQGENATEDYLTFEQLSSTAVFKDIIARAENSKESYTRTRQSTLRLMRDEFMHGPSNRFDKSRNTWREKFKNDDGIELMIPAYNQNLIPNILRHWIRSKEVDIESLLLEVQVRCTCHLCHSSHSGSRGGGESSAAGKGKQPLPAAASSGSSQPSSPAQVAPNPWSAQSGTGGRSLLERIRSSTPSPTLQSSSSSRLSSPSSQDAKGKGKQRMR